ncbi:hypothetical protein EA187_07000 [Lujinxingia sediminis]|uniref:Porin n=1 Tax=Lujinxingia sediminis TaxID=2480984 RepID=A0ABY0CUY6_9DELT|nr:hypothetical protein [Lujinxingia sediminis]RVU46875.1 hypothetical protein EA187_07000 [Lujinxingia sediminis]
MPIQMTPRQVGPQGKIVVMGAFAALVMSAASAQAQEASPDEEPALEASADSLESVEPVFRLSEGSPFRFELSGYGELRFAGHDFGPDPTRPGGSREDLRAVFEQSRFVTKIDGEMPYGFGLEAEIEFEHGGTGSALELEWEEFGEYEHEVEKGGEVLVEELYVSKTFFKERLKLKLGRFYVAVGQLSSNYRPTDYLAGRRSEAETTVLPAVWDEMGLSAELDMGPVALTAQAVNGLDSTGFSSQRWVASGHQGRFELIRASDLAGVFRADWTIIEGVELGGSVYYGNTTRNRPKPDFAAACADGSEGRERQVAPCGYVKAPLLIVDAHLNLHLGPVRAQGMVMWGQLENATEISRLNKRLSNNLGTLRSEVADQALATWGEVGLNVAPWLGLSSAHRLEPFVRLDHYNTMFRTAPEIAANPRFERTLWTGGVSYTLLNAMVLKLDLSHRTFGNTDLHKENTLELMAGFVF